jgi:alkanesulfonate monooxygenase SsuD/methylene tetrahydromethanopterin reductase-like flavin-dependent oxidoreductase (luciferase family)
LPRHSISLGIGALTLADMAALAKQAEHSGLATVWTNDFYTHGAFIPLAAIATVTSRITLGTGIAYAFARSPLVTALTARDLDELSGGRLILGLGSGTKSMNERWHSLPFAHPGPRMRECVEAIRALWQLPKTGHARYQGRV